jgi:ATP:cob(I)alamin adenosyltransferase
VAIYTRTGDAGSTSLFTGQRVSKTHPRVEAYGTLDELNAMLSLCVCAVAEEEHRTLLEALQQHIFWFSAELASDSEQPSPGKRYISSEEIALLEQTIDREMARVPALHQFVLPGRCEAASRLHLARTVARRAERRLVELAAEVTIRQILLRYLNRLSDCLYALARSEDHADHQRRLVRRSRPAIWPPAGRLRPTRPKPRPGRSPFTSCISSPVRPSNTPASCRCRWWSASLTHTAPKP